MTDSAPQVIVVGGGPLAMLTALTLHQRGVAVQLVGEYPATNPPLNPELMLIGGDDALPPIFQRSLESWRHLSATLGVPTVLGSVPAQDLATSAGRVAKLRDEAMLDALGGEPVTFIEDPSPFSPLSLGYKTWAEAPLLIPGTLKLLQAAVIQAAIPRIAINPASLSIINLTQPQLTLQNGKTLQTNHIIFTSARALRKVLPPLGLSLPLRPARGHVLMLQTATPHGLPMLLQRLNRGHLFVVPVGATRVDVHYDAINDPAQSTLTTRHSEALVKALQQHLAQLVPVLLGAELLAVTATRHWLTPDFLPALGPWPGLPGVLVGTGWGGRGAAFAAGAATVLADAITGEVPDINIQPLAPNRFANGLWQVVRQPGSLTWQEPGSDIDNSMLSPKPEYMQNVHLVESPKVEYAQNVQQVGKTVTESAARRPAVQSPGRSKPHITTAAVKGSS